MKQTVCHLNIAPAYRGGERQTELLVGELAARGWRQRLVVAHGNVLAERCRNIENLDIREVARNPFAAAIAARGSALTHAHEARTVYSNAIANVILGIPYVITRRVVAAKAATRVRSTAYRRAAAVTAVSSAARDVLLQQFPDLQCSVIPDAVTGFDIDESAVAAIRTARPGKTLIGHVGALDDSHKGQSTLIEVARQVVESRPDWHFMLCGDGPDEERFREEIGDLGNIELVGWVDNVGDYLAAFDLFAYPSIHEALGSILLDAMSFGLPIVASNVGGIPEFVEDGVNGYLVPPGNAQQLLAAIDKVLSDDEFRRRISDVNVAHASTYDAAHMADAYEALYREILTQV